jgi:hypothetical protein
MGCDMKHLHRWEPLDDGVPCPSFKFYDELKDLTTVLGDRASAALGPSRRRLDGRFRRYRVGVRCSCCRRRSRRRRLNSALSVSVLDEDGEMRFEHETRCGYLCPVNIMIVDASGKAARVLIAADGSRRIGH